MKTHMWEATEEQKKTPSRGMEKAKDEDSHVRSHRRTKSSAKQRDEKSKG